MTEIKLRDYQENLIAGARDGFRAGKKGIVLVSPTGSGKGIILPWIARSLVESNKRVLIMVHRRRLVKQLCKALDGLGTCYDVVHGRKRLRYLCQVGMVKTLKNRLGTLPDYDYILTDESHRATAPEYVAIYDHYENAKRIFLTATPARTDGKGLSAVADHMVIGPTMRWLISEGFLAPYRYFEPPSNIDWSKIKRGKDGEYDEQAEADAIGKSHIIGDAVKQYRARMDGKRCIVFCRGINGAKEAADEFKENGIPAESIDGTMDESEQESILKRFETGETLCLMSADLISEGVDIPECSGVIFLRRTISVILFLQAVGRCLRPKKDGSHAIILDCVGNCTIHGYPCDPREWSLEGVPKKTGTVETVTCKKCNRSFRPNEAKELARAECGEEVCPVREGAVERKPVKAQVVVDEDLIEREDPWAWTGGIDPVLASGDEWKALIAKADTIDKLKQIQRARGYNARWVQHLGKEKGLIKPSRGFMKYAGKR